MAVYTSYVGNWRGDLEQSVSYPNGGQAGITLLARIDRKGSGILVTATYTAKGSWGSVAGSLSKSGWTSSGQVRQFGSKYVATVSRTHSWQYFYYSAQFQYKSSSETSNWYSTGTLTVAVAPKESYTVTYNANGGTGAPGYQTKWYGEPLTLQTGIPERTGYTLLGWGTSASDTTPTYQPGGQYTANTGATLYAVWQINSYTLTANANGGYVPETEGWTIDGNNATKLVNYSAAYGTLPVPVRSGYRFLGWWTEAEGGTEITSETVMGLEAVTMYAHWKPLTFVKVNDEWKPSDTFVKVDDEWHEVEATYLKVNGEWKEM